MNYEPLEITMEISTPICMGYAWLNFDGVIAYLCARERYGQDFYTLPSKTPVPLDIEVPLKKTGKVYHASVLLMDYDKLKVMRIYKRFDEQFIHHLDTKKKKIPIGSGHYKSGIITLPYIPASTVTFYVDGGIGRLKTLLENLSALGKNTSIGFGKVKDIKIKKTDEDYSMVKDGIAMRPTPIAMLKSYDKTFQTNVTFPYWDKRTTELCAVPGTNIEFEG